MPAKMIQTVSWAFPPLSQKHAISSPSPICPIPRANLQQGRRDTASRRRPRHGSLEPVCKEYLPAHTVFTRVASSTGYWSVKMWIHAMKMAKLQQSGVSHLRD